MIEASKTEKFPIKSWCSDLEDGAQEQLNNLANLPFLHKHVAVMPDCHQGYGMPIGGVIATKGVVIPNAVGVDIGCGMVAVEVDLNAADVRPEQLKQVMHNIREDIPVGFSHHKESQGHEVMPQTFSDDWYWDYPVASKQYVSAMKQIGTLGGGNHFIEIQADEDDNIWIMIHSGSRNIGYKVAKHYNDVAKKLNGQWHSFVPKGWELAFLPIETQEAKDYMREMEYCLDFAHANRKLMLERVQECVGAEFECGFGAPINIHHNYAAWESHFNTNVIVHRKGATRAREKEYGIIPGSQGTKSYIVRGLGNADSFESCSHGAGRTMGRKQAKNELDLEKEIALLDEQGVIHSIRNKNDLDEAPSAYKDINTVMHNQRDLVEIVNELRPLAVIKG